MSTWIRLDRLITPQLSTNSPAIIANAVVHYFQSNEPVNIARESAATMQEVDDDLFRGQFHRATPATLHRLRELTVRYAAMFIARKLSEVDPGKYAPLSRWQSARSNTELQRRVTNYLRAYPDRIFIICNAVQMCFPS